MASSGAGASAAAAATANLNAVRETMDGECPLRLLDLASASQSRGPEAGGEPRRTQIHFLPCSASLMILSRALPGPQGCWPRFWRIVSSLPSSLSRARRCGPTARDLVRHLPADPRPALPPRAPHPFLARVPASRSRTPAPRALRAPPASSAAHWSGLPVRGAGSS